MRPGARADIALIHRTALCVLDGSEHVIGRDVPIDFADARAYPKR
jgi:hypothetical protein